MSNNTNLTEPLLQITHILPAVIWTHVPPEAGTTAFRASALAICNLQIFLMSRTF